MPNYFVSKREEDETLSLVKDPPLTLFSLLRGLMAASAALPWYHGEINLILGKLDVQFFVTRQVVDAKFGPFSGTSESVDWIDSDKTSNEKKLFTEIGVLFFVGFVAFVLTAVQLLITLVKPLRKMMRNICGHTIGKNIYIIYSLVYFPLISNVLL
jgi:hypothetical protein